MQILNRVVCVGNFQHILRINESINEFAECGCELTYWLADTAQTFTALTKWEPRSHSQITRQSTKQTFIQTWVAHILSRVPNIQLRRAKKESVTLTGRQSWKLKKVRVSSRPISWSVLSSSIYTRVYIYVYIKIHT